MNITRNDYQNYFGLLSINEIKDDNITVREISSSNSRSNLETMNKRKEEKRWKTICVTF